MLYIYVFDDGTIKQVSHQAIPEGDIKAVKNGLLDIIRLSPNGTYEQMTWNGASFAPVERGKVDQSEGISFTF